MESQVVFGNTCVAHCGTFALGADGANNIAFTILRRSHIASQLHRPLCQSQQVAISI